MAKPVETWQEFRWKLLNLALDKRVVTVRDHQPQPGDRRIGKLDLAGLWLIRRSATSPPSWAFSCIGPEAAGGAGPAEPERCRRSGWPSGRATGLLRIGDSASRAWTDLVTIVRMRPGRTLEFEVLRDGQRCFQVTRRSGRR